MTFKLQFNVREATSPTALIFELTGTIDSSKSLEKLHDVMSRSTLQAMVILMRKVDYINSAGFAEVVVLNERAIKDGKLLVFADLNPKVASVFEHLGGLHILDVAETEESALKKLAASRS